MIFMNAVVLAKEEFPSSSPSEDHESMWSYLTNQLFKWSSLNNADQHGFLAKLIHFTKHEDHEGEEANGGTDFSPAVEYR